MTNKIALVLALLILGLLVLDTTMLHWNLPLLIGREMLGLVEWVSFSR